MRKRSNMLWFLSGAALVLMALLVAVPLAATAIAPEATPTRTPRPSMLGPSYPTPARTVTIPAALRTPPALPADDRARLATAVRRVRTALADQQATARAGRTPMPPKPTRTPGPCDDPKPLVAGTETKTYTTPDGKVSLEYPANWSMKQVDELATIVNLATFCDRGLRRVPGEIQIFIRRVPGELKNQTLAESLGDPAARNPYSTSKREDVSIDGRPALRVTLVASSKLDGGPYTQVTWFFGVGEDLYAISPVYVDLSLEPVVARTISSIRIAS